MLLSPTRIPNVTDLCSFFIECSQQSLAELPKPRICIRSELSRFIPFFRTCSPFLYSLFAVGAGGVGLPLGIFCREVRALARCDHAAACNPLKIKIKQSSCNI